MSWHADGRDGIGRADGAMPKGFSLVPDTAKQPASDLFFLRVTLTKPVALDGRVDSFKEESKLALSSTRPPSARNWSIQLETPARCVIRTILSASSEQDAAQRVLGAIKVAFSGLGVQPGRVAVKAPSIYAEVSYSEIQTLSPA